jgi:hypothetical protein
VISGSAVKCVCSAEGEIESAPLRDKEKPCHQAGREMSARERLKGGWICFSSACETWTEYYIMLFEQTKLDLYIEMDLDSIVIRKNIKN